MKLCFTGDYAPSPGEGRVAPEGIAVGNLECAFADGEVGSEKAYASILPRALMARVGTSGFAALSLANNHVNDAGNFEATHGELKRRFPDIQFFGTVEKPYAEFEFVHGEKIIVIGCLEPCRSRGKAIFRQEDVTPLIRRLRTSPSTFNLQPSTLNSSPNGERREQEITANWFDVINPVDIMEMESFPVISDKNPPVDRRAIKDVFQGFGEIEHPVDGRRVIFPAKSVGKMLAQSGIDIRRYVRSFANIFRKSIRAWSETEAAIKSHKQHRNITAYHQYVAKAKLDGLDCYVRFTIREDAGGKSKRNEVHSSTVSRVTVYKAKGAELSDLGHAQVENSTPFVDHKIAYFFRRVNGAPGHIFVYPHWGKEGEYTRYPSPMQRRLAREWIAAGADGVIGNHAHIPQGMETMDGKPVFYCLGNYDFPLGETDVYPASRDRMVVSVDVVHGEHGEHVEGECEASTCSPCSPWMKTRTLFSTPAAENGFRAASSILNDGWTTWRWAQAVGPIMLAKNTASWKIRLRKNFLKTLPKFLIWQILPKTILFRLAGLWH